MNLGLRRLRAPAPVALLGRGALTAASETTSAEPAVARGLTRLARGWQLQALAKYDEVGECWYPAQFYGRSLSKTRFFPALLNERGEPEEVTSGPLVDLFARIRDPGGTGLAGLAGNYGRLQFLNGDGYLIVSSDKKSDDEEQWEYLSVAELRVEPDSGLGAQKYRRLIAPGATPQELSEAPDNEFETLTGNNVRVSRLWRPHPTHSQLADAPVRAVLELYELLQRLTNAAGGEAGSRAAQRGMLLVAREVADQFGPNEEPGDDPQSHPFLVALGEAYENAIAAPGSSQAMQPIVLMGPGSLMGPAGPIPLVDLVKWIPLGPTDRYVEGEMWEKTIDRIANGLDLPKEILTGIAAANRWSGWLVDEMSYRQHVAPVSQRFCDDLAGAYLRPAAKADSFADWPRVAVGYDPAEAILHPDQVGTAKDAHDRLIISDKSYRDAAGYTDEDAPDAEELARRTLILLKQTPPGVAEEAGLEQPQTRPTEGGKGGATDPQPPAPPPDQPPKGKNGTVPSPVTASALKAAQILGASELLVERGRELAGSRLVVRSKSCEPCRERIREVTSSLVASTLGRDVVRELIHGNLTEQQLVSGIGETLAERLRAWGIAGEWPEQLGLLVEQHTLRTLYELSPPPLPSGFAAAVAKALQ